MEHLTHEEIAVRTLGDCARLQMAHFALAGWTFSCPHHGSWEAYSWKAYDPKGICRVRAYTLLGMLNALEIIPLD